MRLVAHIEAHANPPHDPREATPHRIRPLRSQNPLSPRRCESLHRGANGSGGMKPEPRRLKASRKQTAKALKTIDYADFDRMQTFERGEASRGRRNPPEWASDNEKLQTLLKTEFPLMDGLHKTDAQRAKAGRWAAIIYKYYRAGQMLAEIAADLHIPEASVKSTMTRIRAAGDALFPPPEVVGVILGDQTHQYPDNDSTNHGEFDK